MKDLTKINLTDDCIRGIKEKLKEIKKINQK